MILQTILFPKEKFDLDKIKKYVEEKKLKPIKEPHETENFYRLRITKPIYKSYITKKLPSGIEMVFGAG